MKSSGRLISLSWTSGAVCLALAVSGFAQNAELERLTENARAAMTAEDWQQGLDLHREAAARFGQEDPRRRFGPQFGAVYYQKGVCEMKLGRWDEAMESFEICYRDFPDDGADAAVGNRFRIMALCKWGEAAMGAQQWELAAGRFAKFIEERDRGRDRFPQGAFYVNTAVCQYKLGRLAEGNENLEIALHNKENFPTPESGLLGGLQALVAAAIAGRNEQAMLDFIDKNRGALVMDPPAPENSGVFLKLAGDALAAGMQRASMAWYQLVSDDADSPFGIRLAAIALIHEKNGNLRGACAAYRLLAQDHPGASGRENHLYQLVRTASLLGEPEIARQSAATLAREFPSSVHLAELRASGIEPATEAVATPAPEKFRLPDAAAAPASREFAVALDLYQGRKYQDSKAAFQTIRKAGKSTAETALAGYYELECLRKLGDLEGLASAGRGFEKSPSLGSERLRQLEINGLWECIRRRDWPRLATLADAFRGERLPGGQRAQIAYGQGLALEMQGQPTAALNAYHTAMIADGGASEEIARQAALNVLRIHRADPEVQAALASRGTIAEQRQGPGFSRLREAVAVVNLFELSLGAGMPLPAEFREFPDNE